MKPNDFAEALHTASEMAYKAVMKPTEGTILTVAREIAEESLILAKSYDDFLPYLKALIERGTRSLENTPNLLQVLKDAGVVDSGGKGLLFIFEGLLRALEGEPVQIKESVEVSESSEFAIDVNSDILYTYCTEFLILTDDHQSHEQYLIDKFIKLGDSLVVVQDDGIIKIHVHTNEPWTAMKIASGVGELSKIKIENMKQQHSEIFKKEELTPKQTPTYSQEETDYVLISVSPGDGLSNILKDLGVTYIIEGGQTMNPSTQDFLDIIENTNAKHYILFPNNKNILLAASQAKKISKKNVAVVETATIPEAIAALMNFNPLADLKENSKNMRTALKSVKTGQITYAVRDSSVKNFQIKKDDIIGILNGEIVTCEESIESTWEKLLDEMVTPDIELLTIYYGKEISEGDAQQMLATAQKKYPSVDAELFYGGQPLYYYIISAE